MVGKTAAFIAGLLVVTPAFANTPGFGARSQVELFVQVGTCNRNVEMDSWPGGRFLVTWLEGYAYGLVGYYNNEGVRETPFDITPAGLADVAANPDGGFVAVYESSPDANPAPRGPIRAKIYRPGLPFPDYFEVEDSHGRLPVASSDGQGNAVLAWAYDSSKVLAGRFAPNGVQIGTDVDVASFSSGEIRSVAIAAASDGNFVVFWEHYSTESTGELYYRRFDANGTALSLPVLVAANPAGTRVAGGADGKVAILYGTAGGSTLSGRILDSSGVLGPVFPVWNHPAHPATQGDIALLDDGELAVAAEIHLDGGVGSIHLLRFKADGQPSAPLLTVAIPGAVPGRRFVRPRLVSGGNRLNVVWSLSDDGVECRLKYQMFDATLFADGFETGDLSAWAK